jgi:hypothetical protein
MGVCVQQGVWAVPDEEEGKGAGGHSGHGLIDCVSVKGGGRDLY